jgi:hypothetical protein
MPQSSTFVTYTGDGETKLFTFGFDYLRKEFVRVTVDGDEVPFTFSGPKTIVFDTAPADGTLVTINRNTARDRLVNFVDGSILLGRDLNTAQIQTLHIAQEAIDVAGASLILQEDGSFSAAFRRLSQVGEPTQPNDAVTKEWAETAQEAQLAQTITARNAAQAARDTAQAHATAADGSRILSQTARTGSEAARDAAASSASAAATSASQASTSRANAQAAQQGAETARDGAEAAQEAAEDALAAILTEGGVPQGRRINGSTYITGGGDLSEDRTLDVNLGALRENHGVPVGAIFWFARNGAPPGYLVCNGNGVTSTHAALRSLLISQGSPFGSVSGNPRLPNLTSGNRFIRSSGGSLVVGATQEDAMQDHFHPNLSGGGGSIQYGPDDGETWGPGRNTGSSGSSGQYRWRGGLASLIFGNRTATETRPRNIALLPCIKF